MSTKCAVFLLLLVITGIPFRVRAQADNRTILLLIKNTPGAPTPKQIVDYSNTWPHAAPPPLQAFTVKDPMFGNFLMEDRATGDFLAWLSANPNSVRNKLELYTLMTFPSVDDVPVALAALLADPYVEDAAEPLAMDFSTATSTDLHDEAEPSQPTANQYGWDDMNLAAAWEITGGGYALVAQIDMGLDPAHPGLAPFLGATYIGGNFIPAASKDVGLTGQPAQPGFDPSNVDEGKAEFIPASPCTPVDAFLSPNRLGHGTHVAGLLGANSTSGLGIKGTCKGCGLSMYRAAYLGCFAQTLPAQVVSFLNSAGDDRGKAEAVDAGAQAVSLSLGAPNPSASYNCTGNRSKSNCLTIAYAVSRDAAIVASSGNERLELNFPASDKRVISAGGFQSDLALWDDSPGGIANCPPDPGSQECGSNYSKVYGGSYLTHQELLGSAKHVMSTTYPNTTWVDYAECGDGYGTPMGDGIGWCTGTSMSAPQIAGVVGLLRSINPLVPMGVPEPPIGTAPGVRSVLARTASQAAIGQPWNARVGYGVPDAAKAAHQLLGTIAGGPVRNRATPLFRLYSVDTKDFAETTSPQYALSLLIAQVHDYVQPSTGIGAQPLVPGYAFPYDADASDTFYESAPAAARAAIYVLTTDVKPRGEWPALIPLYLMDKPRASGRDYLLVTTKADIEAAHAGGYELRTVQGYIFQPCSPEVSCIPPGAQALYRQCNLGIVDCATFLESERAAFEAGGYTAAYPVGSSTKLGYAYPATDTDGDGLPDGFEYVVGTSPTRADSDGDGIPDAAELPLAGVPVSDPCSGGVGAIFCPADSIFKDGFEGF